MRRESVSAINMVLLPLLPRQKQQSAPCLHHQKQHINTPEQNALSSITTALRMYSLEITELLLSIVWTLLILPLLLAQMAQATIRQDNHGNHFLARGWHHNKTLMFLLRTSQAYNRLSCTEGLMVLWFIQVHAIFYTLLNEQELISEITWKLARIWRLLRNWFGIPFLVTDMMTACIHSCRKKKTLAKIYIFFK